MIKTLSRLVQSLFFRPDLLQVAALCWRNTKAEPQVLLIRSLDSNRWIIPKGWPMRGKTLAEAAQIEAWEEAGVSGQISTAPIGTFHYAKRRATGLKQPCTVQVFALHVADRDDDFPEADLRQAKWFTTADAIKRVREPDLQVLIESHFAE